MFVPPVPLPLVSPLLLPHGISSAQEWRVSAFFFLVVGLICATVARILLVIGAVRVNVWWALGVFLPFGPLFFRLSYPDLAVSSRTFRFATLPCFFLYFVLGPGQATKSYFSKTRPSGSAKRAGYTLEARNTKAKGPGPAVDVGTLEERWVANFREFQRLHAWNEGLKLRKRDLLHSDGEGNRIYDIELAQYNAALQKATAEKNALAVSAK